MAGYPPHWGISFTKTLHNDVYPLIDPTKSNLSQTSKVVLITGAGRGIGRSIALQYARSGVACIILCARTTSQLDEVEVSIKQISSSIKVRKFTLDITDAAQVSIVAKTVKQEEGRLDILVNNAAVGEAWVPITESNPEEWWKSWEVGIKGTYLMLHALLPLMVDTATTAGSVNVVNIVSIGAHQIIPGASAYQTFKLAQLRLGEFIVTEYADKGVNCFSVHPGGVLTEMSATIASLQPCRLFRRFLGTIRLTGCRSH
jgi:NAD(P)-dependent dehydrogenase (short-subunit alcohol dehydrogenase family)